ncbi:CobW family GTP-binding protein [Cytobacillus gottheilii]|uniref:CobW family GTP-binding protein n=1 Tax=Cytobacillus gottheilii TaxID=859144 RepID=UPI0024958A15|nr:GTP-binding protein [Cytobacillus gottheilii]
MKKIEIYILGGFLGSGKSTLLHNLLLEQKSKDKKVAVLMNELGDFSVDSKLLEDSIPLKELLDGCICCTIRNELEEQLLTLYQAEQPDIIYIETTGAAHPVEVLDACLSPILAPYISFCRLITVVDAKRWLDREVYSLPIMNLMEEQVKFADMVVVNKVDTINKKEQRQLENEISLLNINGPKLFTEYAQVDLQEIGIVKKPVLKDTGKLHVHDHLNIQSFSYTFAGHINKTQFEKWIQGLPKSVLRIKGFIVFEEQEEKTVLFQYAYGVPLSLKQDFQFPRTLVVIGENIDIKKMTEELAAMDTKKEVLTFKKI